MLCCSPIELYNNLPETNLLHMTIDNTTIVNSLVVMCSPMQMSNNIFKIHM